MKLLLLGFLAALAMVAHPANAPPTSPPHQYHLMTNAQLTSSMVPPLLDEVVTCAEVSDDDALYCAYAVLGSEELNVTRGIVEHGSTPTSLDASRLLSKSSWMMFDGYLRSACADERASYEDSIRSV